MYIVQLQLFGPGGLANDDVIEEGECRLMLTVADGGGKNGTKTCWCNMHQIKKSD